MKEVICWIDMHDRKTSSASTRQLLTRGAGEDLKCLQDLKPHGQLILQYCQGEDHGLSQATLLHQQELIAWPGGLELYGNRLC